VTENDAATGRIEIGSERPVVGLPETVLHEIRSHALESVPEECCGLVFGSVGVARDGEGRFQRVYRCHNVMDRMHQEDPESFPRTNCEGFYIDPAELLRAAEEADGAGQEVTAVYHSHVGVPAYFSEMDRDFATQPGFPFPHADHLVVSVLGRQVREIGLFRPDGDGALCGFRVESRSS
jgi:proteasome lid subunit RPN8/RPN11